MANTPSLQDTWLQSVPFLIQYMTSQTPTIVLYLCNWHGSVSTLTLSPRQNHHSCYFGLLATVGCDLKSNAFLLPHFKAPIDTEEFDFR